jgi:hypothetical protein
MISETAKKILKEGKIRVKVKRAGMLQFQVFEVKRIKIGDSYFAELFVDRLINLDELIRIANEFGLPVEAENGRAFPKGKGANDFIGL